jgi:hypothetical protein
MKTIKILLGLLLAITFMNCNSDEGSDNLDDLGNDVAFNYNQGNVVSRNFHGLILDTAGNAISNASVQIGSTTVQTNASGLFVINDASVKEKFAHVKVTKSGFVNGSRVLIPTSGSNRVNIMLIPSTPTATVASGAASEVNLPNGTKVKFDGAFKDASGNAYSGNVQVGLYHLKPSNTYLNEIMPGSLLASNSSGDAKVLETFGMLHVELTGSAGQKLNIAAGHNAEISLDIDAAQASSSPSTIPLWSFDEVAGIWKEEGSATKVGNKYVGNVSHFSWWNCDAPFAQCNLTVTVNNSTGQPISNLNVQIVRPSQPFGATGITNVLGQVTGIVPANENLTVKVVDYCNNVIYTTSAGPFSTGSSNVLPTITLTPTAISTTTISGILKTCTNTNVTNGLVKLKNPASVNFYNQVLQTVTNGSFSFVTNICGASQLFELYGEDYTNLQTTTPITFTATAPVTNIGVINACTATNEFITYQVDSNPVNYIISGINASYDTTTPKNMNISTPQSNPFFYLNGANIVSVGTYTSTNFIGMEFSSPTAGTAGGLGISNTVQFVVSQIGPVGGYIDLTFNGTYTNASGIHTLSGTVHVLRDN